MNEELLTTTQAAQRAHVGRGAIVRATRSGALPSAQAGRYRLIRPADLQAWLDGGGYHPDKATWKGKWRKRGPGRPKGSRNKTVKSGPQ